jgi:transcriptional regulator with XRE-family HTH domain
MSIGDNIKDVRKKKNLTQKKLGEKLGVSQAAIGQFENSDNSIKYETLKKIADALEVPIDRLIDIDSNKNILYPLWNEQDLTEEKIFLELFKTLGFYIKENKSKEGGFILDDGDNEIIISDDNFFLLKENFKRYIRFALFEFTTTGK